MKINIIDQSKPCAYIPMLDNGGVHKEPDGRIRLYWYPFSKEEWRDEP